MPLTPKNRKEEWLQGLVDHETTLTPKNRPEEWMKEIIDASGGGGGTGGGVLVVNVDKQTMTLDKTWNEIDSAPFAVLQVQDGGIIFYNFIVSTTKNESAGHYYVDFAAISKDGTSITEFHTTYADGYPIYITE